ncbi:YraN family protein [Rhizomonospora bruguierae]|uniref:YraN family protein n=1 Tax=Rhizomonospora bruguierae TaxID=1581705 RepID=UPI001BCD85D4|nr:YraN family protein [Micromonospora sp. NBRC 107566]
MTKVRRAVGAYGERVAAEHLRAAGLVVLDRNWRCPEGELDIVARDGAGTLVICEVKTRRTGAFGPPILAVHPAKARRLRRLAAAWLAATGVQPREVRFDVVSVLPQRQGPARVEHVRGAF